MKTCTSSIRRASEEFAEQFAASFDEDVRHLPAAEFVEQMAEPLAAIVRRRR